MDTEAELVAQIRRSLNTALIGDCLDAAGMTRQFLPPSIRPIRPDLMIVGRAMTVLEADCTGDFVFSEQQSVPFGLMLRALDQLRPSEIYICTGSSPRYALWGGLMSARAVKLGCAGAILDGFHRDTKEILRLDFPVFSAGAYAQDQRVRGRVVDFRCPIEFDNGCRVMDGDLLVGDCDGVVAVPKASVSDIVATSLAKSNAERTVASMIGEGQRTEDIFKSTGVM